MISERVDLFKLNVANLLEPVSALFEPLRKTIVENIEWDGVMNLAEKYTFTNWIAYGAGPVTLGFSAVMLSLGFFELGNVYGLWNQSWIEYGFKSRKPRMEAHEKTFARVPWKKQVMTEFANIGFPGGVITALGSGFLLPLVVKLPTEALPTFSDFFITFFFGSLICDFGQYWGHRIMHENAWLYHNVHGVHHQIDTPSVVSTAYVHPLDSFLQVSLPSLAAVILTNMHPVTFAIFTFTRVAENCFDHSGVNHPLINAICLKFLPLRSSIQHHDEHHKYSSYVGKGKNYGEGFIIWDFIFGSIRKTTAH